MKYRILNRQIIDPQGSIVENFPWSTTVPLEIGASTMNDIDFDGLQKAVIGINETISCRSEYANAGRHRIVVEKIKTCASGEAEALVSYKEFNKNVELVREEEPFWFNFDGIEDAFCDLIELIEIEVARRFNVAYFG